ncbi:MAG: hypothetical protein ACI80V_001781 [Rhodothermales bacterium]
MILLVKIWSVDWFAGLSLFRRQVAGFPSPEVYPSFLKDTLKDTLNNAPEPATPMGPRAAESAIGCRIVAPESYALKAAYALETLLRPLGLGLDQGGTSGIWYGPVAPTGGNWLFVRMDPETPLRITSSLRDSALPGIAGDLAPSLFPGGLTLPGGSGQESGDIIASAFYWLAGCDETYNEPRDRHGRPVGRDSLLHTMGLAETAPVDAYREMLANALEAGGQSLPRRSWKGASWCFCPTFDIDYLRKWRPGIIYRELIQNFLLGRGPKPRGARLRSGLRQWLFRRDPYRTAISRMALEVEKVQGAGTFFFKGGASGPHDVRYSLQGGFIQRTFRALRAAGHDIGLHPSYHAFNHGGYLASEHQRLTTASGGAIHTVRTHYLRWDPPATPRNFAANGLVLDSSLGFADTPGFRNGTCLPFQTWDHDLNATSGIWEMPLAMMESAMFNREGLTSAQAIEQGGQLLRTVQQYGGVLVALWHNVLWDEPDFAGWGDHFLAMLRTASAGGGAILPLAEALRGWGSEQ